MTQLRRWLLTHRRLATIAWLGFWPAYVIGYAVEGFQEGVRAWREDRDALQEGLDQEGSS